MEVQSLGKSVIIRVKDIPEDVGVSIAQVKRMERAGLFPRKRRIGPGVVGYLREEVEQWARELPVAEGE
jgi:predicted DNA-binding transcriptional regulator AlpA